jgi:uncharacterized protein YkuJ
MALTKEQLKAIHAKNGHGVSSKSHRVDRDQPTIKRPARKAPIRIPKGDIRHMLTEKEIDEWERVAGSELTSVKAGREEGKNTIEVKFLNGENWFEFQTMKEQESFFKEHRDFYESYGLRFDKEPIDKFIEVSHPKIEGYVNLKSGLALFKDRLMEK